MTNPRRAFVSLARFAAVRRLQTLTLVGALVGFPGASCDTPATFAQHEACTLAVSCYFTGAGAATLVNDPVFAGFFPEGDASLVIETYGEEGSCWRGDEALAASCADRCKGLLWQDCATPYRLTCVDAAGVATPELCTTDTSLADCGAGSCPSRPFCAEACNVANALPCSFDDYRTNDANVRQEGDPIFSSCPSEGECNAVKPPLVGNEKPEQQFGCCDLPGHVDADGALAPILVGSVPGAGPEAQPCSTTLSPP